MKSEYKDGIIGTIATLITIGVFFSQAVEGFNIVKCLVSIGIIISTTFAFMSIRVSGEAPKMMCFGFLGVHMIFFGSGIMKPPATISESFLPFYSNGLYFFAAMIFLLMFVRMYKVMNLINEAYYNKK